MVNPNAAKPQKLCIFVIHGKEGVYLPTIGLLSLISASRDISIESPEKFNIDAHSYYWTETRANRNASDYFGKYYGVSWNRDKYIDMGKERTIIDGFPF